MSDLPPVIAFDGHAAITRELVNANLRHDLPDEVILVLPAVISDGSGLDQVMSWLCAEYEETDIHVAEEFLETLEEYLEKGHEVSLVLLLDPEHDWDQALWGWAAESSVPVRDLAQNLIALGDPPREEETAPAAEPVRTTRPARDILRDIREGVEILKGLLEELDATPEFTGETMTGQGAPGFSGPRIAQHIAQDAQDGPPLPAGDGTRYKYVLGLDNHYTKRGRGRLARGCTQVMLTAAEVENLRAQGLLEE